MRSYAETRLETERFVLRPPGLVDVDAFVESAGATEVARAVRSRANEERGIEQGATADGRADVGVHPR